MQTNQRDVPNRFLMVLRRETLNLSVFDEIWDKKKLSVFDIATDSVAELKLKILFIYGRPVKSHKTCHFQRSEKSILCYRTDIIKIFAYG